MAKQTADGPCAELAELRDAIGGEVRRLQRSLHAVRESTGVVLLTFRYLVLKAVCWGRRRFGS